LLPRPPAPRDLLSSPTRRSSDLTSNYTIAISDVPADHRLLMVDLGLPRNVDPAVAQLPQVELIDLELLALHAPVPELAGPAHARSEEHTSELQSRENLVCRLLLE